MKIDLLNSNDHRVDPTLDESESELNVIRYNYDRKIIFTGLTDD